MKGIVLFSLEKIRQERQITALKKRQKLLWRDTLISIFMVDQTNKQA